MDKYPSETESTERHAHIAAFIQNNLRPVAAILAETNEAPNVTDVTDVISDPQPFEVRPYQLEAWEAIWSARTNGEPRALVTLATGLGKTSIAVFDVIKFREEFVAKEGREPKILFTCHQTEILDQAAARFAHFIPDMTQGKYDAKDKDTTSDITFGTLQSLTGNLDVLDPGTFDYIIFDEAHHAQAETYRQVVEHFEPAFTLAVTATPDRSDGLDIRELFGVEVYSKGLADALAEGWLADVNYRIVFDDALKNALDKGFESISLKELKELVEMMPRNEIIAGNVLEEMHAIGLDTAKTIVYCQNVAHATEMAELLDGKPYHSDLNQDEREQTLAEFRNNGLQIICTVDMFNEGIDIPDARLLVFLRSTQSKTIFEQQLGRGLRKTSNKLEVSVLDFVGNIERIQYISELGNKVTKSKQSIDTADDGPHDSDNNKDTLIDPKSGLVVHAGDHADFIFEQVVVSVLEKYSALQAPEAEEGVLSVTAFAAANRTTRETILKLMEHKAIDPIKRKFGNTVGDGITSEAQEQLLNLELFQIPFANVDDVSANRFALDNGMQAVRLLKILEAHDITPEMRRFGNFRTLSLTRSEQEYLLELPEFQIIDAQDGEVSIKEFAISLGIDKSTLLRFINVHSIETMVRTFRKDNYSNKISAIGQEAQAQIRKLPELQVIPLQEGEVSIKKLALANNMNSTTLKKIVEHYGIPFVRRKTGSMEADALTPESQAKVMSLSEITDKFKATTTDDGEQTLYKVAAELGVGSPALLKLIEKHGIEIGERKRMDKTLLVLSQEAKDKLAALPELQLLPIQDSETSLSSFASTIGTTAETLRRIIEKHGWDTSVRKVKGKITVAIDAETQARILETPEMQATVAQPGEISVKQFALLNGTNQNTLAKILEETGIQTVQRKFNNNVAPALSANVQSAVIAEIEKRRIPQVAPDEVSVNAFSKLQGVGVKRLVEIIESNGVPTLLRSVSNNPSQVLTPDAQARLIEILTS